MARFNGPPDLLYRAACSNKKNFRGTNPRMRRLFSIPVKRVGAPTQPYARRIWQKVAGASSLTRLRRVG